MKVGLDVGSTTIKCVVLDDQNNIVYKSYERHLSQITEKMSELLTKVRDEVIHGTDAPHVTLDGCMFLVVYYRDCTFIYLKIAFGHGLLHQKVI